MELRVWRYFLVVAQEESITKVAALLHLTQPTLSRQLMQLEEELGTKLFHRSQYRICLLYTSYVRYISTRGGIELIRPDNADSPVTSRQKELLSNLLREDVYKRQIAVPAYRPDCKRG